MKEKKMTKAQAGKKGAEVTHKKRYEALTELSKLVNKAELNYLQEEANTKTLVIIMELIRSTKQ